MKLDCKKNTLIEQILPQQLCSPKLCQVIATVPRKSFTPEEFQDFANCECNIMLAHKQIMLNPVLAARFIEPLQLMGVETVLEVGAGSGYMTAILANLCKSVTSIDCFADFVRSATDNLQQLQIYNAEVLHQDLFDNFKSMTKFDAIIVTGGVDVVPKLLLDALASCGILIIPVGDYPIMQVQKIFKNKDNSFNKEILFETYIPHLQGEPDARQIC